ncbi:hypothetical protein, partial [Vibrio nigripulchritudo]|uniref:hypothetical protein n=1 Tax=Vibrio nigripulchritudo TaxID=28173 RepID=UPI001CC4F991
RRTVQDVWFHRRKHTRYRQRDAKLSRTLNFQRRLKLVATVPLTMPNSNVEFAVWLYGFNR